MILALAHAKSAVAQSDRDDVEPFRRSGRRKIAVAVHPEVSPLPAFLDAGLD
jgi:hypothetical protein